MGIILLNKYSLFWWTAYYFELSKRLTLEILEDKKLTNRIRGLSLYKSVIKILFKSNMCVKNLSFHCCQFLTRIILIWCYSCLADAILSYCKQLTQNNYKYRLIQTPHKIGCNGSDPSIGMNPYKISLKHLVLAQLGPFS